MIGDVVCLHRRERLSRELRQSLPAPLLRIGAGVQVPPVAGGGRQHQGHRVGARDPYLTPFDRGRSALRQGPEIRCEGHDTAEALSFPGESPRQAHGRSIKFRGFRFGVGSVEAGRQRDRTGPLTRDPDDDDPVGITGEDLSPVKHAIHPVADRDGGGVEVE